MKLFKLPLYFWCNVFGEIREMPQWVNASLFLVLWAFFGKNCDIFIAAICNMALGRLADRRYFLGIIHNWIKTGFMRKEASSYIQMVFIVCCLQLTAPNKGKMISVSHITDGVFWVCITILWLVHYRNLKKCLFFISLLDNHISPYFNACLMTKEELWNKLHLQGWLTWCLMV